MRNLIVSAVQQRYESGESGSPTFDSCFDFDRVVSITVKDASWLDKVVNPVDLFDSSRLLARNMCAACHHEFGLLGDELGLYASLIIFDSVDQQLLDS